jgi:hypothetical protein
MARKRKRKSAKKAQAARRAPRIKTGPRKGQFRKKVHHHRKAHRRARAKEQTIRTRGTPRRSYKKKNPWGGDHAGHARAAKKGWRRRKAKEKRENAARVSGPGPFGRKTPLKRRKKGGRKAGLAKSQTTKVVVVMPKRAAAKRRATTSARHKGTIRHRGRKTYISHPKTVSYVLENPLSNGELALVGGVGLAWWLATDLITRYLETGGSTAAPTANSGFATDGAPTGTVMAVQGGMLLVPGIAQAFVQEPWIKASLQGATLGALFRFGQGVIDWMMAKALANNTMGQQLYAAEQAAQGIGGSGTTTSGSSTSSSSSSTGTTGRPTGVGRFDRRMSPALPASAQNPVLASRPALPASGATALRATLASIASQMSSSPSLSPVGGNALSASPFSTTPVSPSAAAPSAPASTLSPTSPSAAAAAATSPAQLAPSATPATSPNTPGAPTSTAPAPSPGHPGFCAPCTSSYLVQLDAAMTAQKFASDECGSCND